jgi:hypothetical protein
MILEKYSNYGENKIIQVDILDIMQMEDLNPRGNMNEKTLEELEKVDTVPPIKLGYCEEEVKNKFIIVDGNHRFISRSNRGDEEIDAIIKVYETRNELFKDATLANINHGVRLNKEDRITALSRIINFSKDKTIAELSRELLINERELRKIEKWNELKGVLPEEILGFNISKADVIYRLYSKGSLTADEFLEKVEKIYELPFNELTKMVNLLIEDKDADLRGLAINETNEDIDFLESIDDELDDFDLDDIDIELDLDSDLECEDITYEENDNYLNISNNITDKVFDSETSVNNFSIVIDSLEKYKEGLKAFVNLTVENKKSLSDNEKDSLREKIKELKKEIEILENEL